MTVTLTYALLCQEALHSGAVDADPEHASIQYALLEDVSRLDAGHAFQSKATSYV